MALPNIFAKDVSDDVIARINKLTPDSERQWGKMDVAQMLAHCCVSYEMVYEPEKTSAAKPRDPPDLETVWQTYVRKRRAVQKESSH